VAVIPISKAGRAFRKRTYSTGAAARDLLRLGGRLPSIGRVWVGGAIDPVLRESVMLAVAEANDCRYCAFAHREWARAVGAEEGELNRDERLAVSWSLARLEAGFGPVEEELERELSARYSPRQREDLDTVVRTMTFANLAGNTFEALLSRLRGSPAPDSRLPDELIVGGGFALAIPPVALMLAARRRKAPHRLATEFTQSPNGRGRATSTAG
jgi:AhpD family alkylhydroperoxidase